MTSNDVAILDAVLDGRQGVLAGGPPDSVFELFAIEQILKQYDLADDELLDGQVGGGNDGGLDGVFTFLDGNLVREDSDVLQPAFDPATTKRGAELELWALQAKRGVSALLLQHQLGVSYKTAWLLLHKRLR